MTYPNKICLLVATVLFGFSARGAFETQDPGQPLREGTVVPKTEKIEEANSLLTRFAIQTSALGFGVNATVLRKRTDSAIGMLVELAGDDELVQRTFKLTEAQLDTLHDRWNDVNWPANLHFVDETQRHPDLYDCLSPAQLRDLELAALRFDGLVALSRTLFVKELQISPEQLEAIKQEVTLIRESTVAPRFRRTFANGFTPKDVWEATVDAAAFNMHVLAILNDRQKLQLAALEMESRKFEQIVSHILEQTWLNYND